MTSAELNAILADLDLAETELKLTTCGYINKSWKVPPTSTHWYKGLTPLERARAAVAAIPVDPIVVPPPTPPPTPNTSTLFGVYAWGQNPGGVKEFEDWLGHKVNLALDFLAGDTWDTIEGQPWNLSPWAGRGYRMVWGVPILTGTATLAQGAAGLFDSHFNALARNLLTYGMDDAILRLGWEFGGGWYKWHPKTGTDASNFVKFWKRIVDTMRAKAPDLKFDWNGVWGWQDVAPELCYPGKDYVDFIGCDIYDQSWAGPNTSKYVDPVASWEDAMGTPNYSVQYFMDGAKDEGKPFSCPEWGLALRSDGHGGGDNPSFIQNMHDIVLKDAGYHIYFNVNASDGNHYLPDFPKSAALFKQLF